MAQRAGKRTPWGQIILNAAFMAVCLAYLIPMLLIVSVSFSNEQDVIRNGYSLIPRVFSTAAYQMAFRNPDQLIHSYVTTIGFTVATTLFSLLTMGLMAYPLSRPNYKLRYPLSFLVFFTMLFRGGLVPSYVINTKYLGLKDNFWVYVLPALINAWNLIIIRTNYKQLPGELVESAKMDGASELRVCLQIVMPLSVPVMATIGFLTFVGKWNDWMTSQIYIRNVRLYSLQYLLQRILNEAEFLKKMAQEGVALVSGRDLPTESYRYAMALLAAGPVLVIFPFFQKYFARGLTIGAVKG